MQHLSIDDRRKALLDIIELFSYLVILEPPQAKGPVLKLRRQRKVLLVPHVRPHVMEGIVGLLDTARRLQDAGEVRIVDEHLHALNGLRLHDLASLCGVAGESIIQNSLDIAVVFLYRPPRVEVGGFRILRRDTDECAGIISAQNNSNETLEENDGNLRKHVRVGERND